MAMLRNVFGGCVSDRSSGAMRHQKIRFGVPLSVALKNGYLPGPLVELLVYIAQEGMSTQDLFRRPGNPNDTRRIVKRMSEGKPVIYQNYNMYTLASVVKKFLLRIPDGIFGVDGEEKLLRVLSLGHKMEQYEAVYGYLSSLKKAHQQLISLIYGIWFTMVSNSHVNFMTLETLSRSCAGSIFHSCATDPAKVEKASRMMQLLIENFGVTSMFGQDNIQYFSDITHTGIHIRETFKYQFQYPPEDILARKEAIKVFLVFLCHEAIKRGFNPLLHAISEEGLLEMSQMHSHREHEHEPSETPEPGSPEIDPRHFLSVEMHTDADSTHSRLMAASTVSAPEVSVMPSPEVLSKRPKSLEDNLNEEQPSDHVPVNRSLSRFNSVKRKQLERLRQRSDWFLGPNPSSVNIMQHKSHRTNNEHEQLRPKTSGNSVTKASSEGAALDVMSSDGDSVFSETSRSESPASEPVRTPPIRVMRDIIHSDTINDVQMTDVSQEQGEINDAEMGETEVCFFVVEHKYGEPSES
ncbi:hypothetical protein KUTeg_007221 [Tegillarca granosa]|uniref:Rho-GAP domain-containing protein n=1 Tax=Tegillarca granosa TaxID=220873 RepID=A0ABQ9FFV7_TEGGR|nr:hypothetical protein KUTeg_014638 [Tegillarca granosa]KAJ8315071.1 hypothetical protein KUTeg_007221 [Tegillarca granosa]